MKTYEVELRKTTHATVTVAAENVKDAVEMALSIANASINGGPKWEAVSLGHGMDHKIGNGVEEFDIPQR